MEEALTALLAPVASGHRHWKRVPQGTPLPYVVMNVISGLRDYTMQRASGLREKRVQVDCYGSTYEEATSTARQVEKILSGRRGGIFAGIFLDSERDLSEASAGDVGRPFRISLDFIVHHHQQ